jgi:hypothetical protein
MDGVDYLREDLAFVDRMIAECRHHIALLKKPTAELSRHRQDADVADDVLASFTAALTRYQAERKLVVSALAGGKTAVDPAGELPTPDCSAGRRRGPAKVT